MTALKDKRLMMVAFICFKCNAAGIIGYEDYECDEFGGECPECGEKGREFIFVENPKTIVTGVDEIFHFHKREEKYFFKSLVPKEETH